MSHTTEQARLPIRLSCILIGTLGAVDKLSFIPMNGQLAIKPPPPHYTNGLHANIFSVNLTFIPLLSFFHTEIVNYTVALASCAGTVHYNGSLVIVFMFIYSFIIYIFFQCIYSHSSEVYTLDHVPTLRIDAIPKWIFVADKLPVHTALMLSACVTEIGAIPPCSKKWSEAISE